MDLTFSQRFGYTPVRTEFQINSMDDDLRNSLWNAVYIYIFKEVNLDSLFFLQCETIYLEFFKDTIDTVPEYPNVIKEDIKNWFFKAPWYEIYDFVEFLSYIIPETDNFKSLCDRYFERELSAYRFVNGKITKITEQVEINEIEEAINQNQFIGVQEHLKSALSHLSDRENPDYRNSIKESISAVEAIVQIIVDDENATLGNALKKLEESIGMHPSLKEGFNKIYGYTSDEGGIRHAMQDKSNITFDDAKYMLVSCSAFVNYLISKANSANLFYN